MHTVDHSNFFEFICHLPKQISEAPNLVKDVSFQNIPQKFNQIILTGMGGSAIAGDLLAAYLRDQIKIPFIINRNYTLPNFVGSKTLVLACSYSGNTEETLNSMQDAIERNASLITVASGGKIEEIAKQNNQPFIKIPGGFPPRQALGYMFFSILHTLQALNFIQVNSKDIDETIHLLEEMCRRHEPVKSQSHNFCNYIGQKIYNKVPIIYTASELLSPVVIRWRNQLNENSKTLAFTNLFPELNHNEIMGWEAPKELISNFALILLRDDQESPRNKKRLEITRNILRKCDCPIVEVFGEGKSPLARMFTQIYTGDWVSYYLALLYGKDPIKIDSIQMLKEQLSEIK